MAISAACSLVLFSLAGGCTKFQTLGRDGGDASHDGPVPGDSSDAAAGTDAAGMDTSSIDTGADVVVDAGDSLGEEVRSTPPGSILWARSVSSVNLHGVAEGPTGVVVTGSITAPANLGGALLAPSGATDTVIAQFAAADGAHLYSSRFGGGSPAGTGIVRGSIDTLDYSGAPLLQGPSYCDPSGPPSCNQIDLGIGPVTPGGGPGGDGFVGRYSVATGRAGWITRLVGPGEDTFTSAAAGPGATIYAAGWFDQSSTLVAGPNTRMFTGGGDRDVLIAQLNSATGEFGMTKTFAGPGFEMPTAIAWTGSHIIAAGFFAGMTTFGNTTLSSMDFDAWVAKLTPADGTPAWAVRLGGAGMDKYPYIVVDSAGDIYVTGFISGSATFGAYGVGGAGGIDIYVAKLRNVDGGIVWATSLGSTGDDFPTDIAISSSGQLVISGSVAGPLQAGGPWAGSSDVLIVSYSSEGTRLWTKVFGTTGADGGSGVASGTDAFYVNVSLGADIGPSLEGVAILGAPRPSGLVLKLKP